MTDGFRPLGSIVRAGSGGAVFSPHERTLNFDVERFSRVSEQLQPATDSVEDQRAYSRTIRGTAVSETLLGVLREHSDETYKDIVRFEISASTPSSEDMGLNVNLYVASLWAGFTDAEIEADALDASQFTGVAVTGEQLVISIIMSPARFAALWGETMSLRGAKMKFSVRLRTYEVEGDDARKSAVYLREGATGIKGFAVKLVERAGE
ncbi:MAG TPA: hypothetical protein VIO94_01665 [Phenylobacterium sp.]